MPRLQNHQGRPGTEVIPHNWDASHAPVVAKTLSGRCRITIPGDQPQFDPELGYTPAPTPAVLYDGPYRLQELTQAARTVTLGGQQTAVDAYLLVVGRPAAGIRRAAVVEFFDVDADGRLVPMDPDLAGKTFYVATITRGSHRWERDLTIVDDLSAVPQPGGEQS